MGSKIGELGAPGQIIADNAKHLRDTNKITQQEFDRLTDGNVEPADLALARGVADAQGVGGDWVKAGAIAGSYKTLLDVAGKNTDDVQPEQRAAPSEAAQPGAAPGQPADGGGVGVKDLLGGIPLFPKPIIDAFSNALAGAR